MDRNYVRHSWRGGLKNLCNTLQWADTQWHLRPLMELALDHGSQNRTHGRTQHLDVLISGRTELEVLDELDDGGLHFSKAR